MESSDRRISAVLSALDIMAVLYADILYCRPEEPKREGRDHFVLSKNILVPLQIVI